MSQVHERVHKLVDLLGEYGFEYDYNTSLGTIRIRGNIKYIHDRDDVQYGFCRERHCITVIHSRHKRVLKVNNEEVELPEGGRVYVGEGYLLVCLI